MELSYDLGLGWPQFFSTNADYDSSYPWKCLRFVHSMRGRPVQTRWWKTTMVISFPNPTSDNAFKCSKSCFQSFCFLIGKPSASHGRPATKQLVLQPIADALTLIVISVSCSPIEKLVVGTFSKTALKQYQEDPINCDVTAERAIAICHR